MWRSLSTKAFVQMFVPLEWRWIRQNIQRQSSWLFTHKTLSESLTVQRMENLSVTSPVRLKAYGDRVSKQPSCLFTHQNRPHIRLTTVWTWGGSERIKHQLTKLNTLRIKSNEAKNSQPTFLPYYPQLYLEAELWVSTLTRSVIIPHCTRKLWTATERKVDYRWTRKFATI